MAKGLSLYQIGFACIGTLIAPLLMIWPRVESFWKRGILLLILYSGMMMCAWCLKQYLKEN